MVRKRGEHGILMLVVGFFIAFTLILLNYFSIAFEGKHVTAAENNSKLKIHAGTSSGTIFDRNLTPMINRSFNYRAVAVPSALNRNKTAEYALDKEEFLEEYDKGEPFVFDCKSHTPESAGLTVFEIPERYGSETPAQHIIGYLSENRGVSGLEYAYDSVFRNEGGENSVTYTTDGIGRILIGGKKDVIRSNAQKTGVVTTIDSDIQRICERAWVGDKKGAVVVTDISSGDILAMASFPTYSAGKIEEALNDEQSPMINRALYSYSVGSIFKLVTACEAIEEGYGGYMYCCDGSIDINGVKFRCHAHDGHGIQDISDAMSNSCNTYFISMSRNFSIPRFRELVKKFGFGREIYLCGGISGSAGVLPTMEELMLPAELANLSFGQGKLTATPLQISAFTCAIANGGELPELRLIKGMTLDGESVVNEKPPRLSRIMDAASASQLRRMMNRAINGNEESNARTIYTKSGAKTSTAQTGRYNDEGEEYCHGWITGFFPIDKPEYAVTVLVEDGGYGNDAAAPVFREIVDKITIMDTKKQLYKS